MVATLFEINTIGKFTRFNVVIEQKIQCRSVKVMSDHNELVF